MKRILLPASLLLIAVMSLLGTGCAYGWRANDVWEGMAVSGLSGVLICFAVIAGLIGLFFFVVWIIALVDCAKRKPDEFPAGTGGENAKTMWLVILIVTFFVSQLNGIAAIVYYFMVMRKKPRK
ncbi:MAG: DUF2516 family protein [Actinomycetota bacterium]